MEQVLTRLRRAGLTLNVEKCKLVQTQTEYLGHKIGNGIIAPLREKTEKIRNAAVPTTKKKFGHFWGWQDITKNSYQILQRLLHL